MMRRALRFVLCLPCLSLVAAAAPMLTVTPELLDFGKVREGAVPEATLTVHNTGDAPAEIQRLQSSCSCVVLPELSEANRVIAPGERREYTFRYETIGHRGRRGATIALSANDANSPHPIKVAIDIETALRVVPRTVHWSRARRGAACPESVTITSIEPGTAIELVSLRSSLPHLQARGEQSTVEGRPAILVAFALDESAPIGPLNGTVEARVLLRAVEHAVQIPVTANVVGDFLFYPSAVVSVDRPILRGTRLSEITIIPSENARVSVLDVTVTGPIQADLPEPASARKIVIPVFISPDAPPGPQAGKVTVITSSRELPLVSIPVYFETLPPVTIDPATVVMGPHAVSHVVKLRSEGEAVVISDPRSTLEGVSAVIVNAAQKGADPASIEIRLDSQAPAGESAGFVYVTSNIIGMETVSIPVAFQPRVD